MKKLRKLFLLAGILGILLCGSALAAGETAGIYDAVSENQDVTLTPLNGTPRQTEIQEEQKTLNVGAKTLKLTYEGKKPGPYVVWVLRGREAAPGSDRVVYMDQGNSPSFVLRPKNLEPGEYGIYLSGASMDYEKVGSFRYYKEAEKPEPSDPLPTDPAPAPTEPESVKNPFQDVSQKNYYYDAVLWAVGSKVTSGTDESHFSPNETCTRAQVISFLWRAAGRPEPESARNPFRDVGTGAYYYKAVLWAVEQGVAAGTDESHFNPNAGCTRAQVVSFLWRYAGRPTAESNANPFRDVETGNYYYKAVLWAVEQGVTAGTDRSHFSPASTCTRTQTVSFLWRYLERGMGRAS